MIAIKVIDFFALDAGLRKADDEDRLASGTPPRYAERVSPKRVATLDDSVERRRRALDVKQAVKGPASALAQRSTRRGRPGIDGWCFEFGGPDCPTTVMRRRVAPFAGTRNVRRRDGMVDEASRDVE